MITAKLCPINDSSKYKSSNIVKSIINIEEPIEKKGDDEIEPIKLTKYDKITQGSSYNVPYSGKNTSQTTSNTDGLIVERLTFDQ